MKQTDGRKKQPRSDIKTRVSSTVLKKNNSTTISQCPHLEAASSLPLSDRGVQLPRQRLLAFWGPIKKKKKEKEKYDPFSRETKKKPQHPLNISQREIKFFATTAYLHTLVLLLRPAEGGALPNIVL